ncbi:MAG TPA: protein kinase [Thermoanaerobaculia bacterium]|jgi:serine/threonine protein kinase|nr:protein kinase [Thermoanaerobaculia bacterium]
MLVAGTRLGPYEILAPLGAGGMGEVYRAKDPRLGRQVAIKILSPELASDPERLQRFEQEARAASALSHPHILAVFDFRSESGTSYLVTELLEGETLRARLAGGALPVRKAVDIAIQTARGLAAAHEQGIVHRDLKPENLFLTRDGQVKILDFGLAKLPLPDSASRLAAATTVPGTEPGVVMGTVGYMAPEQARGLPVDARADLFSLGAILYEMLAGRRAFQGSAAVEVLNAILRQDPPDLQSADGRPIPLAVELVVRHCLEKDREARFQSARDFVFALEALSGSTSTPGAGAPSTRRRIAWGVAGLLLVGLLGLGIWLSRMPDGRRAPLQTSILAPPGSKLYSFPSAVLSPDGRQVVLVAIGTDSGTRLWIRSLDKDEPRPLDGTTGAQRPFWSPDGRSIAFFAEGKLKRIPAEGGPVQTLAAAPMGIGGVWGEDGTILFAPSTLSALWRVDAGGGTAVPVTRLDRARRDVSHRWPAFLPGQKRFLVTVQTDGDRSGVYVGTVGSPDLQFLFASSSNVLYAPPGYLLFAREGNLVAQRFDAGSLELSGEPVPLAGGLSIEAGAADFSVAGTGALTYRTTPLVLTQLLWFDRTGQRLGTLGEPGYWSSPRISPDGRQVAVTSFDPQTQAFSIWLVDVAGGRARPFAKSDPGSYFFAVWSPDQSRLALAVERGGAADLYAKGVDGGAERALRISGSFKFPTDWSSDGRLLLYTATDSTGGWNVEALPLAGGPPLSILNSPFTEYGAQLSPDRRWLAYVSDANGRLEVYVRPFARPGADRLVSSEGGFGPRWRRDGRELFYTAQDGRLMAVPMGSPLESKTLDPGPARGLFDARLGVLPYDLAEYDVAADGQRFLVNQSVGRPWPEVVSLLLDWTAKLPR